MAIIKRTKVNAEMERQIVIGLATSDDYLSECAATGIIDYKSFNAKALAQCAEWCTEYYKEFGKAPKDTLVTIYTAKTDSGEIPDELVDEYASVFSALSDEYVLSGKGISPKFLLKETVRYMKKRKLQLLGTQLSAIRTDEDLQRAELQVTGYTAPEAAGVLWSNPFELTAAQKEAVYHSTSETLFQMPGALGRFLGPEERGTFVAIQAPEKRGKTWWLWEFALRGWLAGNNVAFFSVADMSEVQNFRRVHGWALHSTRKYAGMNVSVPQLDCAKQQRGECGEGGPVFDAKGNRIMTVKDYEPCCKCKNKVDFEGAYWTVSRKVPSFDENGLEKVLKRYKAAAGGATIRTFCSSGLNVHTIRNQLQLWKRLDNWQPNIVIIDYADVLIPEPGSERWEPRHQINESWKAMRRLSLDLDIALYTGTQASKGANIKAYQDVTDASEDKRKNGHVTRMLALNQTPIEKRNGIMRLSSLISREDNFDIFTSVVCLQWLPMSRPLIGSYISYGSNDK